MSYPERKPIYEVYEKLVNEIINNKFHKIYARSEIKALNNDLSQVFQQISERLLLEAKKWPAEE